MLIPNHFISIDWGTSNFRLQIVETSNLSVIQEIKLDQGIKIVYNQFKNQHNIDQTAYFLQFLEQQIQQLPEAFKNSPAVLSGMASSNIGLLDVPYARFPFHQNGQTLNWEVLKGEQRDWIIISGVMGGHDVMRGEETQAIGLVAQINAYPEGILILPGTHSKHLVFKEDEFTRLQTFMTGEYFELLSRHSILANSILASPWDQNYQTAFLNGVEKAIDTGIASNLFAIRANHVLYQTNKKENYYHLSGLLIGEELSYLANENNQTVVLAAPEPLSALYHLALTGILKKEQIVKINEKALAKALLIGQRTILRSYNEKV